MYALYVYSIHYRVLYQYMSKIHKIIYVTCVYSIELIY